MDTATNANLPNHNGTAQERVADAIDALLGLNGRKKKDLAEFLHVDAAVVSRMLKPTADRPQKISVDQAEAIAAWFDVPVTVLFAGGDEIRRRVQNWKKITPATLGEHGRHLTVVT